MGNSARKFPKKSRHKVKPDTSVDLNDPKVRKQSRSKTELRRENRARGEKQRKFRDTVAQGADNFSTVTDYLPGGVAKKGLRKGAQKVGKQISKKMTGPAANARNRTLQGKPVRTSSPRPSAPKTPPSPRRGVRSSNSPERYNAAAAKSGAKNNILSNPGKKAPGTRTDLTRPVNNNIGGKNRRAIEQGKPPGPNKNWSKRATPPGVRNNLGPRKSLDGPSVNRGVLDSRVQKTKMDKWRGM